MAPRRKNQGGGATPGAGTWRRCGRPAPQRCASTGVSCGPEEVQIAVKSQSRVALCVCVCRVGGGAAEALSTWDAARAPRQNEAAAPPGTSPWATAREGATRLGLEVSNLECLVGRTSNQLPRAPAPAKLHV